MLNKVVIYRQSVGFETFQLSLRFRNDLICLFNGKNSHF